MYKHRAWDLPVSSLGLGGLWPELPLMVLSCSSMLTSRQLSRLGRSARELFQRWHSSRTLTCRLECATFKPGQKADLLPDSPVSHLPCPDFIVRRPDLRQHSSTIASVVCAHQAAFVTVAADPALCVDR